MNKISSFSLKREGLFQHPTRLLGIKEADVEAHVDGLSNANIFTEEKHFHVLTPTQGKQLR